MFNVMSAVPVRQIGLCALPCGYFQRAAAPSVVQAKNPLSTSGRSSKEAYLRPVLSTQYTSLTSRPSQGNKITIVRSVGPEPAR